MAAIFWPKSLPQKVLSDGYSRDYADDVQATEMELGPPKTRLKSVSALEPVQCTLLVTATEIARFRRFFRDETKRGALPFRIPDQIMHGRTVLAKNGQPLLMADGRPLLVSAWWRALFTPQQTPNERPDSGVYFRLSFSLLVKA